MGLGELLDAVSTDKLGSSERVHQLVGLLAGRGATGDDEADLRLIFASIGESCLESSQLPVTSELLDRLLTADADQFSDLLTALIELRDLAVLARF